MTTSLLRSLAGGLFLTGMFTSAVPAPAQTLQYPAAPKSDVVDDYHGTRVPDPYRWLEDPDSPESRAWIEAQNRPTAAYLAEIPARAALRERLTKLWNYPKYGTPFRKARRYFFFKNDGLQNQSVLYKQASLTADPETLLDPNVLSEDGTVALSTLAVSDDGRYAVLHVWLGTDRRNRVYYLDLKDARRPKVTGEVVRLLDDFDASYAFVGNDGPVFYFLTDLEAPRKRVIAIDSISGERKDDEMFYAFTSFLYPTTIFRYDFKSGGTSVFKAPTIDFDPSGYETKQVFYTSKDGTRVPMFITHKKGLHLDGSNPTYLYGYGGFNISLTPSFSVAMLVWLEQGGVYAVPNLRGGGEYGEEWHQAGMHDKKQNVFDDFIAAAEYLIAQGYTSPSKLAIAGGSNGGLLVGAAITQRPELFGAALPAVGVMDMLRFHKFTIGWAWVTDYGSADSAAQFPYLYKYSPLHNIRAGTRYPATLVTTADHDDRVVPGHSFKFTAALQAAQAGPRPVLIEIETKAGHGAGKPTSKLIEEQADRFAFLVKNLGMQ